MKFRLISIISMSLLAMSLVAQNPVDRLTNEFSGNTPSRGAGGACTITNIQGGFASGYLQFNEGGGILAVYFDPTTDCDVPGGFNFNIDSVRMTIADASAFGAGTGLGTADFEVTIHEVTSDADCATLPGAAIASSGVQTLNLDASGTYDVNLTGFNVSVNGPVFVAWRLADLSDPTEPVSPLWDGTPNSACQQFLSQDGGANFTDFQTFFIDGATGLVDFEVTGSAVNPIPTLGEWGLIAFITLMAGAALVMSRKRRLA